MTKAFVVRLWAFSCFKKRPAGLFRDARLLVVYRGRTVAVKLFPGGNAVDEILVRLPFIALAATLGLAFSARRYGLRSFPALGFLAMCILCLFTLAIARFWRGETWRASVAVLVACFGCAFFTYLIRKRPEPE